MKLFTVPTDALAVIVRKVSAQNYAGNILIKSLARVSRNAITFTLTVRDSNAPGSRRSKTGRRIAAACWHAHRDIMAEIFSQYPDARLVSQLADYKNRVDFLASFPGTGATNLGSIAKPMRADTACNCVAVSPREQYLNFRNRK